LASFEVEENDIERFIGIFVRIERKMEESGHEYLS
jgi:hypothetical protein